MMEFDSDTPVQRLGSCNMPQLLRNLWGGFGGKREKPLPAERPCVQCQKPHRHTNAFCSAACCELHRVLTRCKTPEERQQRLAEIEAAKIEAAQKVWM